MNNKEKLWWKPRTPPPGYKKKNTKASPSVRKTESFSSFHSADTASVRRLSAPGYASIDGENIPDYLVDGTPPLNVLHNEENIIRYLRNPSFDLPDIDTSAFNPTSTTDDQWALHYNEEGYGYYYNSITGESRWENEMDVNEISGDSSLSDDTKIDIVCAVSPKRYNFLDEESIDYSNILPTGEILEEDSIALIQDDETLLASPSVAIVGDTILHGAVSYNYIDDENVEDILVSGIDPNSANLLGETPLHRAAQYAYFFGIETLIRNGADPKLRDMYGQTVFHYAAICGIYAKECLEILSSSYPEGLFEKDNLGNTVLHTAIAIGASEEIVTYLSSKLNVNDQNSDGDTALHLCYACKIKTNNDAILLKYHADVSILNSWGSSPLSLAAFQGMKTNYVATESEGDIPIILAGSIKYPPMPPSSLTIGEEKKNIKKLRMESPSSGTFSSMIKKLVSMKKVKNSTPKLTVLKVK